MWNTVLLHTLWKDDGEKIPENFSQPTFCYNPYTYTLYTYSSTLFLRISKCNSRNILNIKKSTSSTTVYSVHYSVLLGHVCSYSIITGEILAKFPAKMIACRDTWGKNAEREKIYFKWAISLHTKYIGLRGVCL